MKVKPLNRLPYYQLNRTIYQTTIQMYRDMTKRLLKDASPLELATEYYDKWEMMAQTVWENDLITHRQCVSVMGRIARTVTQMMDALGVDKFGDLQ